MATYQRLSPKAETFVRELAKGKSVHEAGKIAGYSNPNRDALPYILNKANIKAAYTRVKALMVAQGAPYAYDFLMRTLQDEDTPLGMRVTIARDMLAYGGLSNKNPMYDDPNRDDDVKNMSRGELQALLAETQREISERSKPVVIDAEYSDSDSPNTPSSLAELMT